MTTNSVCKYCSQPIHTIGGRQASVPAMCLKHYEVMLFINRLINADKPVTLANLIQLRNRSQLLWHFTVREIPELVKPMEVKCESK